MQSQTADDVPAFSLFPEGAYSRGGVPVRTLGPERGVDLMAVPHRLDEGKSAEPDTG